MKGTHNPRIQARKCVASNAEYPTHIAVGRDSHPLPNCVLVAETSVSVIHTRGPDDPE